MNPGQCRYLKPGFNWAKGLLTPGVTLTLSEEPRESLNPAICGNLGASSYLKNGNNARSIEDNPQETNVVNEQCYTSTPT